MFPQLPVLESDPERILRLCSCHPFCKSRRRIWKGEVQATSYELLLERKPVDECVRRWPKKVYGNSPCPLFGKTRYVHAIERGKEMKQEVVRICQAPMNVYVDCTYLHLYRMAKKMGAINLVKEPTPMCSCCGCCPCTKIEYQLHDPEREKSRRRDMRDFDTRVKEDSKIMRIMYN
ncbi:uncharacterized protein LOC113229100 [Hyposmocoma kahamanoa]|uniref:uncharacterized protein LOC113229100 n=1 Tax=Hyposmocoma kahamanoa TaxID=1477025 RepID=UPI000E6D6118|nr:uncharacterized protein LOC113229100 [Hyposmocoma kahamanoa]